MPSTYSTSLRLELMADGEKSGTWGTITNTNLGTLIEQGVAGVASVAHDDSASYTLTTNNGSSDEARNAVVLMTGALTADREVIVPDVDKVYIFKNGTSGGFALTFKTSGGTGVTIPNGRAAICYVDSGTGTVNAIDDGYFTDSIYIEGSSAGDFITAESTNAGAASGPDIKLYRNSASPADGDVLSKITFTANTDDGAGGVSVEDVEYASINVSAPETNETSGEAGKMVIALKRGGTTQNYIEIQGGTSADADNDSIVFKTGGIAVLAIDNNQDMLIDTDSKLQFRDSAIYIQSGSDGNLSIEADTAIAFDTDTLYVDSANDRVGINQATPYVDLQVNGDMRLGSTNVATDDDDVEYTISSGGQIKIHANDSGADASFVALSLRTGASGGNAGAIIDFYINDDEKMRLNNDGYLGLGTNNPLQELHVFNDGTAGTSADNADVRVQGNNGGSGYMDFFHGPTSMGIYGASASPFQLAWNSIDRLNINGSETIFHDTGADYNFRIESTSYENMFFVDSGDNKIGIRTNAPDAVLDVAGSLRYYNLRPGYTSTVGSGSSANWWKLGRASSLFGSRSLKITILGTNSYGAGGNIGGQTTILFRGNNSTTTIDGTFWSETQGNSHISGVAWKQTGTDDEFDIWVNWSSTFAGVDIYVDTSASWAFGVLDTGSETTPSGATTISPQKHTFTGTVATISEYSSAVVVNEGQTDINFRVESDDYDHALFVDAGTNKVLIGSSDTTHSIGSYSLIVGVESGTMKPHVLIDGTFTQQDINTHGFINLSDQNFGIGGGNFNTGSTADDLYLFAYEGVGRAIRFSTTLDGTSDRSEDNANWTTRGLIEASTGYWGIGNFSHSSPPSRQLHVKGAVADVTPILYLEASSDTFSTQNFNWASSSIASGMPNTASKRFVHIIGQAQSNGQAAAFGYAAGTNNNEKAVTIGLFNKNDLIMANMNGYVTKQYQPFFYAKTTNVGDGNTANPYQFQNVVHNIGGMFVTTGTGAFERFVAPIDGVYAITVQPAYKQTGVDFSSRLRINGSEFTDLVRLISTVDPDSHSGAATTVVIKLSEDDYVDVVPGFTPYHCNSTYNFFSAHLLS